MHKNKGGRSIPSFGLKVSVILCCIIIALSSPVSAIETAAKQAILIDMTTGAVLFNKNADERMPPSSMSKIMTVYKVFERLRDGRLSLNDTFAVSEKAWRKQGSKMFVAVNSRVKVEDLIRGIIVQSSNDAHRGDSDENLKYSVKSIGYKLFLSLDAFLYHILQMFYRDNLRKAVWLPHRLGIGQLMSPSLWRILFDHSYSVRMRLGYSIVRIG